MSVRSSILALLTLGPAYGLQLHSEIEARTARTGTINVGQIYSTLNRLVDSHLVAPVAGGGDVPAGPAPLPLYALTPAGRAEAETWLSLVPDRRPSWDDLVEHVLLVSTLPGADLPTLLAGYRQLFAPVADAPPTPPGELAEAATRHLAGAALAWLADVDRWDESGELAPRGLSSDRPRRGRRPHPRS